jgi:hypothetical protein
MKSVYFILLTAVLSTSVWAAGLTAHIGCFGSLGAGRGCTGDTVTCVSTGQSDLPMTWDSLLSYYTINGFRSETAERLGQPTTIRLPLSDTFPGPFSPPFYVVQTKPSGELDIVYLTSTYGYAPGTFTVHTNGIGQIIFGPGATGTWQVIYATGVVLSNCDTDLWQARIRTHTVPKPPTKFRFHRVRATITMPQ